MRMRYGIAGLLYLMLLGSAHGEEKYLLQPGDSLEVWVAQEDDLRRNVVVEPDGWVSFPLAGHLKAEGLTVTQVEAALSEKLRPFFKENPNLTIMLRPDPLHQPNVFMAGEVTTPGSFPYRKGMTVLHGVSVAGGLHRSEMLAADQDRSIVVKRSIEAAQSKLEQLAARYARFQAELNGGATVEVNDKNNRFIAQEQTLLDAYRQSLTAQTAARHEAEAMGARNLDSIKEQMAILGRRIVFATQRRDATAALVEKGALQAGQQFDRENELAELQSGRSQLDSEMTTVQRAMNTEIAVIDTALRTQREKLLSDIVDLERDQQATRESLADAQKVMQVYENGMTAARQSNQRTTVFTIIRTVDGEPQEIEANEMTPLEPGDLVRVMYQTMDTGAELSLHTEAQPASNIASSDASAVR
ncbi:MULTISPECIES: polysaccharide biosynthesis/export family protein [unclassified Rhizobium]|uniref:polysaccharide biosynthesis/export family protein n=1 Tax=unclassified Rhizobium TaxID=2613769 RepID=UPI0009F1739F|nr:MULTISPECIES: polysaccharide biosynthesis/export family protein [unclassified Rhizobium]MDM9620284.1 polysaccharide biosynthesis/export family protein [Rhizobium sp. S96]